MAFDDDDDVSGVYDFHGHEELSPEERARVIAGRYEIESRLGSGAMGQVIKVRHRRLGKPFALKLMQADLSLDRESQQTFIREARLASALSHENIVSIADFGADPDWGLYLVMEYVEGESLAERIVRLGPLPVSVTCDVVSQLASALEHSHAQRVIHADIKPDNILCMSPTEDERRQWMVKLLDYGMAHVATQAGERQKLIGGTPEYMAPERAIGGAPSATSDVYALGVVMFEMLTGGVPFAGSSAPEILEQHIHAERPTLAERIEGPVPAELERIVICAMARNPRDRYPDAPSFLRDVAAFMEGQGLFERQKTRPEPDDRAVAAAAAFDALILPAAGLAADGTVLICNAALAGLMRMAREDLEGGNITATPLSNVHAGLAADIHSAAVEGKIVRRRVVARGKGGRRMAMRLVLAPGDGAAGPCILVLHPVPSSSPSPS